MMATHCVCLASFSIGRVQFHYFIKIRPVRGFSYRNLKSMNTLAHLKATQHGCSAAVVVGRVSRMGRGKAPFRKQMIFSTRVVDQAKSDSAQASSESSGAPLPPGSEKIYVGKGQYIVDDPSKYPGRNALTGGFAGGEVGLKNFVAENGVGSVPQEESDKAAPASSKPGKNAIYVGKGRFMKDDLSNKSKVMKMSARDNSLVGGFAGGEVGLRQFVETGEVPFDEQGKGRRQQSPLIIAGIVSITAVTGGILLTDVSDFGEHVISGSTEVTPDALSGLDENTKLLLEAGVLMMGVVASVIGGKALLGSLRSSIKEGATRLAVLAAFWMAVFIAAQFVLDSN